MTPASAASLVSTVMTTALPPCSTWAAVLIAVVPTLAWLVLIAALAVLLHRPLRALVRAVEVRLGRGEPIKLWALELKRIPRGAPHVREVGGVSLLRDEKRQEEIHTLYEASKFILLVDTSYPAPDNAEERDVVLFVQGHWTDLCQVQSVEYALDSGWEDAVFVSSDRTRSFAIKVSPTGSVLCTARVRFVDGSDALVSRYIYIEPRTVPA